MEMGNESGVEEKERGQKKEIGFSPTSNSFSKPDSIQICRSRFSLS